MSIRDDLLTEIEEYLDRTGTPPTAFGLRALNDGKFVFRLRGGGNVTSRTIDKARAFMAEAASGAGE